MSVLNHPNIATFRRFITLSLDPDNEGALWCNQHGDLQVTKNNYEPTRNNSDPANPHEQWTKLATLNAGEIDYLLT